MHRLLTVAVAFNLLVAVGPSWARQCLQEAADCNGLRAVDLADPGHPVEVGSRLVQDCGPYVRGAVDVAVKGTLAYIADGDARSPGRKEASPVARWTTVRRR